MEIFRNAINYKVEFSLNWYENCILSNAGNNATFTITGIKLYLPIVTLKTEDNTKSLKYLSNFWRSLEMPLINYKVELSLNCIENCVRNTAANANKTIFKITDAKIYVRIYQQKTI